MRPKQKATPKQLRRTGYLVAAFAVFVLIASIVIEIDYHRFSETALRTDARIVKVDAIREGKRFRHVLHYEIDHGGRTHRFSDTAGRDTKLEELYSGTFNAFTGDDPPLQAGRTIGLLVNPQDVSDHRPDRAKVSLPAVTWLAPLLGVLFLSGVSGFLFWIARELPPRTSSAPPQPLESKSSHVGSSREGAVLRVRAKVDVPWLPQISANGEPRAELEARMRELKGPSAAPLAGTGERCTSVKLSIELRPDDDAQLYEARVDFLGASGEQTTEVIQRAITLRATQTEKLEATLDIPSAAKTLRLVLVLADRSTWQHELAL